MCNIIFLDIDGVLNSGFRIDAHQGGSGGGVCVDREKVRLLAELVHKTNAKLVLHSGWRFWFDSHMEPVRDEAAGLVELLAEYGMGIFDVTPDFTTEEIRRTKKFSLVKAKEILAWLAQHEEGKNWVVMDDLDLHNELVSGHQIKTDPMTGLTRQDIERAEAVLSMPSPVRQRLPHSPPREKQRNLKLK